MKVNMPVTDREVMMKPGTILVTRTNHKGIITYANDAFVEISGFSFDELVGKNHNVVRHPDMPPAAFEDLWQTIKNGKPWTAPVKNRTKSGDYYWVEANVTPVYKNGKIDEFLSVRYAPSREQISQAEDLYQKLNANKANLRPTGMALMLKNIKEMNIWNKTVIALAAFLAPIAYLIVQLFQSQNYVLTGVFGVLAAFASFMTVHVVRLFSSTLDQGIGICYRLADEQFRNAIDLNRNDLVGDFNRAIYSMQVKLNSDMARSKQEGAEATRIKQALDNVSSCVMVANNNLDIIYMNDTVQEMFNNAESDIRKQLPNFEAAKLLGTNVDVFHKNPAHQRGLMANLNSTIKSTLEIGGRYMNIVANPVKNDEGERIGIVVEWLDRTHEVKIEHEIQEIVDSVKMGQLDKRLNMSDKEGFFKNLSQGINEVGETVEKVMNEIAHVMSGLAEGDLTRSVTQEYQGVYGKCKEDINVSLNKLSEVFSQIRESADFILNTSQEIASGNNNLSQRVETQASSLEETASSMEELTGTVKNNSDNAQQANQLSNTARMLAEKGGNVVVSAVSAMSEINESSNKIAEIIGVIDEIAFQTNLLALNASVEAARAGEQGRGFSVVATEVRNLAQRSAVAARESKELIQNSVQKVRSGTELVNETGSALNEIVNGVKQVGDIVAEIAAASVEQSQGIDQVNQAVSQMDEITQQNAALAEEASAASVSMSDQANSMSNLLNFFQIQQEGSGQSSASSATTAQTKKPAAPPASQAKSKPAPRAVEKKVPSYSSAQEEDEWEDF